jgi:hypothetical protein
MIPKTPAPDLIRGGKRFSEKIMLKQKLVYRFHESNPIGRIELIPTDLILRSIA